MAYRVETALSNRSVCNATECKNAGIKIDKDELRFGVWVDYQESGNFKWRHWGCVSGFQLQGLRNLLVDPEEPDTYRWDRLDGYDGDEKNSLDKHPDLQEKVRRAVENGCIDPEDFNGDPEMNKLGEKGLHTAASKSKMRADKNREHEINELRGENERLKAELATLRAQGASTSKLDAKIQANERGIQDKQTPMKPTPKKRAKDEDDEDAEEKTPVKKKRATKAKKEEDGGEETKPAKKSRARKVKKEEDDEMNEDEAFEPAPPAKRSRAKKAKKEEDVDVVKNEDDADAPAITAPKKRAARGKKAVKEEEADEQNGEAVEAAKPKPPAKKGRKKAVKEERSEDTTMTAGVESSAVAEGSTLPTEPDSLVGVKGEPSDAVDFASAAPAVDDIDAKIAILKNLDFNDSFFPAGKIGPDDETVIPGIKDLDLQDMISKGVDYGDVDDGNIPRFLEQKRDEMVAELEAKKPKPKKKGRGKKANAAAPSTRTSRSRTASKA